LTGFSFDELLERSFESLLVSDSRTATTFGQGSRIISYANIKRFEGKFYCADGSTRWADFILGSITFEGREATIATAFDITDRKQSEVQLVKYQQELRSLTAQLSISEERERRRMASYLHDTIGATLAFCKIKLGELQAGTFADTNLKTFNEIRQMLTRAIQDTRSLTVELSPPILYELGLVPSIEWLLEKMMTEHRMNYEFIDDKSPKPLDDEVKVMLFHSVRELLVNVIKHAEATFVSVKTQRSGNHLEIIVQDNGKGFNSDSVLNSVRSKSWKNSRMGFGLFNIRERISHIGGETIIQSDANIESRTSGSGLYTTNNGTTIILRIPLSVQEVND
jgi:PAS domain S-box-containing protein